MGAWVAYEVAQVTGMHLIWLWHIIMASSDSRPYSLHHGNSTAKLITLSPPCKSAPVAEQLSRC